MMVLRPCIKYGIMYMLTCVEQMKTWEVEGRKKVQKEKSLELQSLRLFPWVFLVCEMAIRSGWQVDWSS